MNARTVLSAFVVFGGLLGAASSAIAQGSPPDSPKAKEIAALVDKAAALVKAKGKAALPEFRKSGSEWRSGDTYLFGNYLDGMQFLNAGFPEREGTDGGKTKDANGKVIFQEFLKVTKSREGAGWASYMWPKPGQTQPSQKWSYVKAVQLDGKPAIIGAGFYPQ